MLPKIVMEGRLTADPELRFLDSGVAVCSFTLATNDRRKNESTGQWEDAGDPLFIRISAWRQLGENCAESLAKGDLVVASGKLQNRRFEDKEGNTRFSLELSADWVAASLLFRTIKHGSASRQGPAAKADEDPFQQSAPEDSEPPF